jgi:hypothetical protein
MNVTMNLEEYDMKMMEHLKSNGYVELDIDPTKKILKDVTLAIKNSTLDQDTNKKLSPKDSIVHCIYGLLKIHKAYASLRCHAHIH